MQVQQKIPGDIAMSSKVKTNFKKSDLNLALGVNKKTAFTAVYGELGPYPLYIGMKQFWIKLHKETTEDSLLKLEMAK